MRFDLETKTLVGEHGSLAVAEDDELVRKLAMLIEGECEGLGPISAAQKYGYSKQRYFQLVALYRAEGSTGLVSKTRGPKRNYRRTDEVLRQVIRYRFLDPQSTPDVIAQKLRQTGFTISTRSVERVIADYGLQKKSLPLPPAGRAPARDRNASQSATDADAGMRPAEPGTRSAAAVSG